MYKVELTRLATTNTPQSNPEDLRTNVIEGEAPILPTVGASFYLVADPMPGFDKRWIGTSTIQTVKDCGNNIYEFNTLNSTYKLKVISNNFH